MRLRKPAAERALKPPVLLVANFLDGPRGNPSPSAELVRRLGAAGWRVCTTSSSPHRMTRVLDMVQTVWRRRHAYAVAHVEVYSGPAFVWAELVCLALRLTGKPYALSLHGGRLPAFARRWPGRVRRLLGSARAVIVPSAYLQTELSAFCSEFRLLPNPVDLHGHTFRVRTRPKPVLLWLRAFHHIYNPVLAVQVVACLAGEFPGLHLTMIGPDKRDGSLQASAAAAADLGIADRVSFRGAVPKSAVPGWLNGADIFLNTTNVDNVPVSVLEAMASGLCVVSTDVGGLPYLLDHERDALLVPPADAEGCAAAVRRLLREEGLAPVLSANGRRKAEGFGWARILPEWETLLAEVAQGEPDRGRA